MISHYDLGLLAIYTMLLESNKFTSIIVVMCRKNHSIGRTNGAIGHNVARGPHFSHT